jgi:hypothetical protein
MTNSEDNVWAAAANVKAEEKKSAPLKTRFKYRGERPTASEVLTHTFQLMSQNFAPFAWSGAPAMIGVVGFLVVIIVLLIAAFALGTVLSGGNPDSLEFLAPILGVEALMLLLAPISFVLQVGAARSVWWHISGKEEITFSTALAATRVRMGQSIIYGVITISLSILGVLACYLPVFLVMMLSHLALAILVVEDVSAMQAYKRAFRLFRDEPGYHFKVCGLGVLVEMAILQIPIVGWLIGYPTGATVHLLAYTAETENTI